MSKQVVYELRLEFLVKALLLLAAIPRSTYYYWVKHFNRPNPDGELKTLIQSIYDEHEGRYSYRRIRDEFTNCGHKINHKRIKAKLKGMSPV
ncbi:transposase (plasmid) [Bacillus mycoides]|nr:transposase [Bacillus mycoides]